MNPRLAPYFAVAALLVPAAPAATSREVLVVVNEADSLSRRIAAYYVSRRGVPARNVCRVWMPAAETVPFETYRKEIEEPVGRCLRAAGLQEQILYIVTTAGVPLRAAGPGNGRTSESCAVDSELCLLYARLKGGVFPRAGAVPNPFFGARAEPFRHARFPLYLVTRLAGYSFADVKGMIDRSLAARNCGRFVLDLRGSGSQAGDDWLREAARRLPRDRVLLDESADPVYNRRDVIGYASWGSNDAQRRRRMPGFGWLPGAIATEFVSTNGRTFLEPPANWSISTWEKRDRGLWFAGSPQTLTADYIREGATGCSGHVYEPYLAYTPRPDYLLPAYCEGRTLAESYYLSIPALSWQNIVVGDPLCRLGRP